MFFLCKKKHKERQRKAARQQQINQSRAQEWRSAVQRYICSRCKRHERYDDGCVETRRKNVPFDSHSYLQGSLRFMCKHQVSQRTETRQDTAVINPRIKLHNHRPASCKLDKDGMLSMEKKDAAMSVHVDSSVKVRSLCKMWVQTKERWLHAARRPYNRKGGCERTPKKGRLSKVQ